MKTLYATDLLALKYVHLWPQVCIQLLQFYTTWNLLFVIFYKYTSKHIDVLTSCLITAFASLSVTRSGPNGFTIPINANHQFVFGAETDPFMFYLWDTAAHWLPLVIVLLIEFTSNATAAANAIAINNKTTITAFTILFFFILTNSPKLYGNDVYTTLVLFIMAIIARLAISKITFNTIIYGYSVK